MRNSDAYNYDDDIDDIMSSIMQGQARKEPPASKKTILRRPRKQPPSKIRSLKADISTNTSQPVSKPPAPVSKKGRYTRSVILFAVLACLLAGGVLLWRGPLSKSIRPRSPFSSEISQAVDAPLYFPTKLPGSFKMELNSITQPEPSVVVYTITDEQGRTVNVSMQKQPANLALDPLYNALTDARSLNTKFGTVKTGVLSEDMEVTNILANGTWIIITADRGVVQPEELELIIQNLEA